MTGTLKLVHPHWHILESGAVSLSAGSRMRTALVIANTSKPSEIFNVMLYDYAIHSGRIMIIKLPIVIKLC